MIKRVSLLFVLCILSTFVFGQWDVKRVKTDTSYIRKTMIYPSGHVLTINPLTGLVGRYYAVAVSLDTTNRPGLATKYNIDSLRNSIDSTLWGYNVWKETDSTITPRLDKDVSIRPGMNLVIENAPYDSIKFKGFGSTQVGVLMGGCGQMRLIHQEDTAHYGQVSVIGESIYGPVMLGKAASEKSQFIVTTGYGYGARLEHYKYNTLLASYLWSESAFYPYFGTLDLGTTSYRWNNIYSGNLNLNNLSTDINPVYFLTNTSTGDVKKLSIDSLTTKSVTYARLTELISDDSLVVGNRYIISDFKTVHYFLDSTATVNDTNQGVLEPIVVTALSSSKISSLAYSTLYPQDILHYDYDSSNWLTDPGLSKSGIIVPNWKGVITYRKDTRQNVETYYDFRNVKFRRWALNPTTWSAGSYAQYTIREYSGNIYVSAINANSAISDMANGWAAIFEISFHPSPPSVFYYSYKSTTLNRVPVGVLYQDVYTFEPMSMYSNVNNISIGKSETYSLLTNNVFYINDYSTGFYTYGNTLGSECYGNTFGFGSHGNVLESGCYYNAFDMACFDNYMLSCEGNFIGALASTNHLVNFNRNYVSGYNYFSRNRITGVRNSNIICQGFDSNEIQWDFSSNGIAGQWAYMTVFHEFMENISTGVCQSSIINSEVNHCIIDSLKYVNILRRADYETISGDSTTYVEELNIRTINTDVTPDYLLTDSAGYVKKTPYTVVDTSKIAFEDQENTFLEENIFTDTTTHKNIDASYMEADSIYRYHATYTAPHATAVAGNNWFVFLYNGRFGFKITTGGTIDTTTYSTYGAGGFSDAVYSSATGYVYAMGTKGIMRIDTGTTLGTKVVSTVTSPASHPYYGSYGSMAEDGSYVYVMSESNGWLYKYDISTFAHVDSVDLNLANAHAMEVSGNSLYITNNVTDYFKMLKVNKNTLTVTDSLEIYGAAASNATDDLTTLGNYVYVGFDNAINVLMIDTATLSVYYEFITGTATYGLWNDGTYVYATSSSIPKVAKINPSTFAVTFISLYTKSGLGSANELGIIGNKWFYTGWGTTYAYTMTNPDPSPNIAWTKGQTVFDYVKATSVGSSTSFFQKPFMYNATAKYMQSCSGMITLIIS